MLAPARNTVRNTARLKIGSACEIARKLSGNCTKPGMHTHNPIDCSTCTSRLILPVSRQRNDDESGRQEAGRALVMVAAVGRLAPRLRALLLPSRPTPAGTLLLLPGGCIGGD